MDWLLAQGIADVVTSSVSVEAEAARPFGLTIAEWVMLLGALTAFLEGLRQRAGKLRGQHKMEAVQEALGEAMTEYPESRRTLRRLAKVKATKMGVSLDVIAKLLESKDDCTPDPEDDRSSKDGPSPEKLKEK